MTIGIIVAMDKELQLLLPSISGICEETADGYTYYTGTVEGRNVCVTKCGIGKVNAAIGTLALINRFKPDLVINTGVAGGAGGGASVLDVVVADRIAYHDVWCGPGTVWGEASGCPRFFRAPEGTSDLARQLGAKCGLIASGDIFVSREEDVRHILSLYPATKAVDMESGAIAQVCYMRGVPMYCVRVLSDTPGSGDNIAMYENFWNDAPHHTFEAVRRLIHLIA